MGRRLAVISDKLLQPQGGNSSFNRPLWIRTEEEIQLSLNISTYEVPSNLEPDPATGYKT